MAGLNMSGLIDDMNALAFKVRFGSTTVDDVKVLDSATANIAEMRAVIGFLMGGLAATHWALAPERLQSCLVDPLGDAMDGALILARRGGLA